MTIKGSPSLIDSDVPWYRSSQSPAYPLHSHCIASHCNSIYIMAPQTVHYLCNASYNKNVPRNNWISIFNLVHMVAFISLPGPITHDLWWPGVTFSSLTFLQEEILYLAKWLNHRKRLEEILLRALLVEGLMDSMRVNGRTGLHDRNVPNLCSFVVSTSMVYGILQNTIFCSSPNKSPPDGPNGWEL